eukprot:GHVU01138568.1.p1 GENE.GHVU01138568.1~~GHVU01138568.1.p1  ORF type:complete len:116 (-),score=4.55 GHVU01138568.1:109-456(-)
MCMCTHGSVLTRICARVFTFPQVCVPTTLSVGLGGFMCACMSRFVIETLAGPPENEFQVSPMTGELHGGSLGACLRACVRSSTSGAGAWEQVNRRAPLTMSNSSVRNQEAGRLAG